MVTVHVGLPQLKGDLARYAQRYELLEVRPVDTPLPKAAKLRQWRKQVPPSFVFSVVLPGVVAELRQAAEAEQALTQALEAADALEARCLVLTTPVSVTPTALNKKRLGALVEKLPRDVVVVAWEPRGVWSVDEAATVAGELGLHLLVDATQETPPKGAILYTRLRGIGAQTKAGPAAIARVREAMRGRREVFAVVETGNAGEVAKQLRAPLESSRAPGSHVVRPAARLSAEDEEQ